MEETCWACEGCGCIYCQYTGIILRGDNMEKIWWTSSSGQIEFQMTLEQAQTVHHQGRCDKDVETVVKELWDEIKDIDSNVLRLNLKEYGAWNSNELSDHEANLNRLVWIAAGDICEAENKVEYQYDI